MIEVCLGLQPAFEINVVEGPGGAVMYAKGEPLLDGLVGAARAKELEHFGPKGVWIKRPKNEAFTQTGRPPISVRWVDVSIALLVAGPGRHQARS